MKSAKEKSPLREALAALVPSLKQAFLFSVFVNVLVLAPSAYMMQVYDRVVNSRSHMTLLMLTLMVVGVYALLEALEWVRRQVMHDAGMEFDKGLRSRVFGAVYSARLLNLPVGGAQALKDLKSIREFLPSPAMLAVVDAPLALLVLSLIHI